MSITAKISKMRKINSEKPGLHGEGKYRGKSRLPPE
jgi:hypothetical protein